ncbi:MAG: NAD(P)-binding domain-containing protein [Bacteroidales bacterium]|nr:NAD(P)-binding domain-containing protein [Bacteroidales bacterium]
MKKIGIIGSGVVGQTLANGFIKAGYQVMIGTREPSKLDTWKENTNGEGKTGTFRDTASFGDLIVLATKGTAANKVLEMAGFENLKGKIVIDATNPISAAAPDNGVLKFFTNLNKSLMEELQELVPDAKFVKAFNSVGSAFMVDPKFSSKPTMFICGNDPESKKEVSRILEQFGWEAADFGGVESARAIEPLCMLWCIPGMLHNEWTHAFKLLKR